MGANWSHDATLDHPSNDVTLALQEWSAKRGVNKDKALCALTSCQATHNSSWLAGPFSSVCQACCLQTVQETVLRYQDTYLTPQQESLFAYCDAHGRVCQECNFFFCDTHSGKCERRRSGGHRVSFDAGRSKRSEGPGHECQNKCRGCGGYFVAFGEEREMCVRCDRKGAMEARAEKEKHAKAAESKMHERLDRGGELCSVCRLKVCCLKHHSMPDKRVTCGTCCGTCLGEKYNYQVTVCPKCNGPLPCQKVQCLGVSTVCYTRHKPCGRCEGTGWVYVPDCSKERVASRCKFRFDGSIYKD